MFLVTYADANAIRTIFEKAAGDGAGIAYNPPPLGGGVEGDTALLDEIIEPVKALEATNAAVDAGIPCAWIIIDDEPDFPGSVIARFATTTPTVYIMTAESLDEIRAMLLPSLIRSVRQLGDPPGVVEIWFSPP